jgi:hypothetical protein
MLDVHTSIPGRVEKYDVDAKTVDVKPMLRRVLRRADGSRVAEALPVIPSVPVRFPSAGGFYITFPIKAGDTGLIDLSETAIDRWRATGEDVDPADERRHGLSGATFEPGLRTIANPIADASATDMRLGKDGAHRIDIRDDGTIAVGAPNSTEHIALGDVIKTFVDVFFNWVPVANDGGAALQAALVLAFPLGPPTVASKHEVEP